MYHRPKLQPPPKLLCLLSHFLLLLQHISCLPTLNQALPTSSDYLQNYDEFFTQPPAIQETIQEVQKILEQDPSLPRLTRGEIEELYEKVTREEYEKSIEAGDLGRADSMRALMLVLPYNTDNNTEENLQDLYTRPPVTKVIDSYPEPQPIQFLTHDPHAQYPITETAQAGNYAATTYKPALSLKAAQLLTSPTTYHPSPPPPVMYRMTPSLPRPRPMEFQPVAAAPSALPLTFDQPEHLTPKPLRYSSHYNAKHANFLKTGVYKKSRPQTTTVRPVADVLESLGIVGQTYPRKRTPTDDYYSAESAPKPVISSYVPQAVSVAELQGLRNKNLAPKIKSDAYSSFKPLNIGEEIRIKPEVEDYLTRFGIVGGRKRKALKKGATGNETSDPISEQSEIATSKVPTEKKSRKSVSNTELEKLIENLQQLERLNVDPKVLSTVGTTKKPTTTTTARTTTTSTTKRTTTTTTTTTEAPTTRNLITNGEPLLVEPKKPRRRIDPNLDINFGSSGNQQTLPSRTEELGKLLENLQELERLQINPENVLKTAAPKIKAQQAVTKPISATTRTPIPITASQLNLPVVNKSPALINRFSAHEEQEQQQQPTRMDAKQLQQVLKELQALEQANLKAKTARTSTTTSTTKAPARIPEFGSATDLFQLRKLLTDDNALERLYEQARSRRLGSAAPTTSTSSTTTTTTTTTTTKKPGPTFEELQMLQQYLLELDRKRAAATTTTTSTTTTSTSTTTTTPKPTPQTTKQMTVTADQLQELFGRVQQLERLSTKTHATEAPSFVGLSTRNVAHKPFNIKQQQVPMNDFARLQELYEQVQQADETSYGKVEISTAATAAKAQRQYEARRQQQQQLAQAQRFIDATQFSAAGNTLLEAEPNDFVQLQKLLSKVKELERVKISPDLLTTQTQLEATLAPNWAQSVPSQNLQHLSGFPSGASEDLRIELPAYHSTTPAPALTTFEEAESPTENPNQYQKFFSNLSDDQRNSYKNLQPPMIHKTIRDKEPPRFVSTRKPSELVRQKNLNNKQKTDLEELQKLLNNAQQLQKLGVSLPQELSQQLETKLDKEGKTEKETKEPNFEADFKKIDLQSKQAKQDASDVEAYLTQYGLFEDIKQPRTSSSTTSSTTTQPIRFAVETTSEVSREDSDSSEKTVVFSLTTPKPLTPTEPKFKELSENTIDLPTISAVKIIEAAIKRAASRIGVGTELPHGFSRRNDITTVNDDLVAESSDIDYETITMPEINRGVAARSVPAPSTAATMLMGDQKELRRLINNLQELQKLNVSIAKDMQREADVQYLESFKTEKLKNNPKHRRQSAANTSDTTETADKPVFIVTATSSANNDDVNSSSKLASNEASTTTAPTRINLNLKLDDDDDDDSAKSASDIDSEKLDTTTSSTASSSTTTEESRNGALSDLADSFGPDPNTETPPPAKKKNGFYFLADWNSFLEVGEGNEQVVVRFSPRIGDPRLFLPIKVP